MTQPYVRILLVCLLAISLPSGCIHVPPDMLPAQDSVSRQVSPFAQAGVAVAPVTGVHTSVWQMVNGDVMVQIANLSRGAYPFLKAVRFV